MINQEYKFKAGESFDESHPFLIQESDNNGTSWKTIKVLEKINDNESLTINNGIIYRYKCEKQKI